MKVRTILTKPAFQGIFASAYGTLNVESSGYVAGERIEKKVRNDFVAELIQPAQRVKRTCLSVEVNSQEEKRIKYVLNGRLIGGFHSHWNLGHVELTEEDVDVIRGYYPKGIEFLTTLDEAERLTPIKITPSSISGTFSDKGKKYRMGMYAYYLDFGKNGEKGIKRRTELIIPRRVLREYF